jgi:hypothetical protein
MSMLSLIIVSLISGIVSAETMNLDIDDKYVLSNNFDLEGTTKHTPNHIWYLKVRNVEQLEAPFTVILDAGIISTNESIYSDFIPVSLYVAGGGPKRGQGTMGYRCYPDGTGYIWLDVESFTHTGSGNQAFAITISDGTTYASSKLTCRVDTQPYNYGPMPADVPLAFGEERYFLNAFSGKYIYNVPKEFKHKITLEYGEIDKYSIDNIAVDRVINGIPYESIVEISGKSGVYHQSTSLNAPISVNISSLDRPYQINVFGNATSLWYNQTALSVEEPTPTPTDDNASITVYIRNSQTGAAIANSRCIIDALVGGEYHPVVNRTELSGIFSVTLRRTGGGMPNPDGYRLIASADGYNNPMPEINFTVDEYTTSIYCYLDPIAGGPVDENKTFIDFFVRDMSANPISGATVNFGGYTLLTNSQGYTVFEVGKNATYTYTVSKSGYGSLTGNVVIGAGPRHTINTVLAPAVTPTTPTPIPTSTSISPTPTMTAPTGEPVSNWLEWFASHFGMILGGGVEIGKIFMWLCFTVPVGVYVGKEAKAGAAGFMAGAGIVTLFFVLIGWVPIWLVVLLVLIIGLLYAKVFNNSDNGGGR